MDSVIQRFLVRITLLSFVPDSLRGAHMAQIAMCASGVSPFVPLSKGIEALRKLRPRFLRQGVGANKDPLLVSPLCASQGGESISPPQEELNKVILVASKRMQAPAGACTNVGGVLRTATLALNCDCESPRGARLPPSGAT